MPGDTIDRWIQEVEEAKKHQQFQLNEMAPKEKGLSQRITRSQGKRSGDDPSTSSNAPPPKKPLSATATATSKQSTSTAEDPSELESAGITLIALDEELLPSDSHPLYTSASEISSGSKTIPITVRDHKSTTLNPVPDHKILGNYHLSSEAALRELDLLRDILDEAARCVREAVHEADWNCTVHSPLLCMALKSITTKVRARNITSAAIVHEYVACNLQTGEPLPSHKVDFCIALEPEEAMSKFVDRQDLQTINQTLYSPLKKRPIAVSIETKSPASHTTGMSRLAIWTYAWFARVTEVEPGAHIPALPLLRIVGHDWYVLWAWKHSEAPLRMNLTSDLHFGHTRGFHGVYQILAMLRRLVKWVEEVFQPWAAERFK